MQEVVQLKLLENFDKDLALPRYESLGSAGADIRACLPLGNDLVIPAGKRVLIPTGLAFSIPKGFEIQVRPRSGLSLKTGLLVVNSPGTIDSDYRGEVKIIMGNLGDDVEVIRHGDRIAQLVIARVLQASFVKVDTLDDTGRGSGGFGSTGKN